MGLPRIDFNLRQKIQKTKLKKKKKKIVTATGLEPTTT